MARRKQVLGTCSSVAPEAFAAFAHLSDSCLTNAASPAGVVGEGSMSCWEIGVSVNFRWTVHSPDFIVNMALWNVRRSSAPIVARYPQAAGFAGNMSARQGGGVGRLNDRRENSNAGFVARKECSVFREYNRPLNPGIRFTPSGLRGGADLACGF
jgi:hypothetical protein